MVREYRFSRDEFYRKLEEIIGIQVSAENEERRHRLHDGYGFIDFIVKIEEHLFAVEWKPSSSTDRIVPAIKHLQAAILADQNIIPLLGVPYMGEVGKKLCEESQINWFDLSGNAYIHAPRFRIHIEGKPNLFKRPGRPANLFAPKSSRITRHFLLHPEHSHTQSELTRHTGLDKGLVSKIVRKLEDSQFILRDENNAFSVADPALLMNAWHESYDFSKHRIIKGHISARPGEQLLKRIARFLLERNIEYAATGLASAWQYTHFAAFRIVSVYLHDLLSSLDLEELGFREEESGANTWFVLSNDSGVFNGSREIDGIRCASPLQTYLDLKGHPERSKEAAEELKKQHLRWDNDDD